MRVHDPHRHKSVGRASPLLFNILAPISYTCTAMNKDQDTITLHSKGGRLYVKPSDILSSESGKKVLARFKESSIYQAIKQREHNSSSAA